MLGIFMNMIFEIAFVAITFTLSMIIDGKIVMSAIMVDLFGVSAIFYKKVVK